MRKKCIAILMVLLCITSMIAVGCGKKTYEWPTSDLAKQIPVCDKGESAEINDFSNLLSITISGIEESDYEDYLKKCKSAGFTIDAEETGSSSEIYEAFNKDGYSLSLYYDPDEKELLICLQPPIEMKPLDWPTTGVGALLPIPQSKTGYVVSESESIFSVYVGETDKDAYNTYVKKCMDAGFTVDYIKDDDFYYADNPDGVNITINYTGYNTMAIRVFAPSGFETKETTTAAETTTQASSTDLRKMADDYEAFVDEYCAFMQQYKANPGDPQLLTKYTEMMSKASEYSSTILNADMSNASSEDILYFTEVVNRCTQKIMETGF